MCKRYDPDEKLLTISLSRDYSQINNVAQGVNFFAVILQYVSTIKVTFK